MAKLTPGVGSKGVFFVKPPYVLSSQKEYTCVAVRSFVDCYRKGEDVERLYYAPVGLTPANSFDFDVEVNAGANIVSLQANDGSIVYVPDTYIATLPDGSKLAYANVLVSVYLGILPVDVDLSAFIDELSDIAATYTGVLSNEVNVHVLPLSTEIDADDQTQYELTRQGQITQTKPSSQRLLEVLAELDDANEQIRILSNEVVGN